MFFRVDLTVNMTDGPTDPKSIIENWVRNLMNALLFVFFLCSVWIMTALSFSLRAKGDEEAEYESQLDCDELHLKGEQWQVCNTDPVHLSDEAEKAQVDSCTLVLFHRNTGQHSGLTVSILFILFHMDLNLNADI